LILRWLLPLLLLTLAGSAPAGEKKSKEEVRSPEQIEAEHTRITTEMKGLAERQIWVGVERKFIAMLDLEIEPHFQDLLMAAQAARGVGDVKSTNERLKRAAKFQQTEEITDWIWDIDQNYGHVEILGVPNKNRELYEVVAMFAPDKRQAVQFAKTTLEDSGTFVGLLPHGEYVVMGETFAVEPGLSIRLDYAGKRKKKQKPQKSDGK
jgi:hypothetical protein